jgi:hypothetical protein
VSAKFSCSKGPDAAIYMQTKNKSPDDREGSAKQTSTELASLVIPLQCRSAIQQPEIRTRVTGQLNVSTVKKMNNQCKICWIDKNKWTMHLKNLAAILRARELCIIVCPVHGSELAKHILQALLDHRHKSISF